MSAARFEHAAGAGTARCPRAARPTPAGGPVAEVRPTRDDIARRVEALVAELDAQRP